MRISIGLELDNEGRALAWALDFPGCFAFADEGPEAVIALARELAAYEDWVNRHTGPGGLELGNFDLRVVDTWQVVTINDQYDLAEGGYAVNAWFWHDWKPLTGSEIERGLDLLRWSREDLLQVLADTPVEIMDRSVPGERWSIRGIARHVANAEWWYLDRLGLAEEGREKLPQELLERLDLGARSLDRGTAWFRRSGDGGREGRRAMEPAQAAAQGPLARDQSPPAYPETEIDLSLLSGNGVLKTN